MAPLSARSFVTSATLLALLMGAVPSHAACNSSLDPDKTDIANARAAVAANCNCTGATTHRAYVSCAAQQANAVLTNKSCAVFVKKCASKSTCGRFPFVTCCRTRATGVTKCAIKSTAGACVAPTGGTACAGQFASCCDACTTSSCATTTTTSTTTTTLICCADATSAICGWASSNICVGTVSAGAPGSVCDSTMGTCNPPPPSPGPCCDNTLPPFVPCFAGPAVTMAYCTNNGGTFHPSATCTPQGRCL